MALMKVGFYLFIFYLFIIWRQVTKDNNQCNVRNLVRSVGGKKKKKEIKSYRPPSSFSLSL
jgi:hypothetical protein